MYAAFVRRYLYLPETKGKSLEEMLRYFQEITKESVTGKGGETVGGLLSDRGTCATQLQSRVVVLCSFEVLWLLLLLFVGVGIGAGVWQTLLLLWETALLY